jgi:hypothetical protein
MIEIGGRKKRRKNNVKWGKDTNRIKIVTFLGGTFARKKGALKCIIGHFGSGKITAN